VEDSFIFAQQTPQFVIRLSIFLQKIDHLYVLKLNTMMKKHLLSLSFIALCFSTFAQNIPVTNLYMFQLATKDGNVIFTNPIFASKFNPDGYNNQPSFFSENEVYVTVQTKNGVQTEIYALNADRKELTRVTETNESEYSPTVMPDNRNFSVVRVDANGEAAQRLWKYPINRSSAGSVIFPNLTNVGYHFWINENEVALFLVDAPNQLVIGDIRTGMTKYVARNPGRCFKRMSNGNIAVVHKSSDEAWFLKELNINDGTLRTIVQTLGGSEDFEILSDGSFIMARGSKMYKYKEGESSNWELMTDLNGFGIQSVTRMAVSRGGKIVLVGQ